MVTPVIIYPVVVNVIQIDATAGSPFAGTVAYVDDRNPTAFAITANILWGDGTASIGTSSGSHDSFQVSGSHTYASDGNYTIEVAITDSDNRTGHGFFSEDVAAAPCYCPGTLIRTEGGDRRVETLAIGDVLMTASGVARPIKWIGRRSFGGRFIMGRKDILPVCVKAESLGDKLPRRDLWISPHHAMYFENERDGVLIEAKDLVNGVSIVQAERAEKVEYFHIELESHDVILAEGAPSESFVDDDSRSMFHNAGEYTALYPGQFPRPARYCAPRLDFGYEVEAIRRNISQRAGLTTANQAVGGLRGYIDAVKPGRIEGWAQNVDHPEAAVCLDIYVGDRLIGQTLANRYREDLERAGIGCGRNAFEFELPPGAMPTADNVEVRRSLDGAALSLSVTAKTAQSSVAA